MQRLTGDIGDEKPIFSTKGTLTSTEIIFCCLNLAIGTGPLKLGQIASTGPIFAIALLLIIGILGYCSLKLYVLAAAHYHEGTFEEIWPSAFSRSTIFIPVFCSIVSACADSISYTQFVESTVITIATKIIHLVDETNTELISEIESHSFLIGCCVLVLFFLPTSFSTNIKYVVYLSYVKIVAFGLLLIYVIVRCIQNLIRFGFDPTHSFKLFNIKDNTLSAISTGIFAYSIFPFTYPNLRHCNIPTVPHLSKMFLYNMITLFLIYFVMGLFNYLTFVGTNTDGSILDYYPEITRTDIILLVVGNFFPLIHVASIIPIRLNSIRYIILNAIHKTDTFTKSVWSLLGVILSITFVVLSTLPDDYLNIVFIFSDALAAILQFVVPPIFYLKAYGLKNKGMFLLSIVVLLVGLASVAFMLYVDIPHD